MNACLFTQNIEQINHQKSIEVLEAGSILFFPNHFYAPLDPSILPESILDPKHKNVSYDYTRKKLGAFNRTALGVEKALMDMMHGYAAFAHHLVEASLPTYAPYLQWGRTSYRPAEIKGRVSSKRKDDTRLHVDSFSASPVNGLRILRVFCNINPRQEARVWNVGEPLSTVIKQFESKIPRYNRLKAHILKGLKVTKTLRSPYDHYMLSLHDTMKQDDEYQASVEKKRIDFPAQSSWIVYTDHVSHAALSGQYLLEQTFYLPVNKMMNPHLSPFYEWEKFRSGLGLPSS